MHLHPGCKRNDKIRRQMHHRFVGNSISNEVPSQRGNYRRFNKNQLSQHAAKIACSDPN